MLRVGKFWRNDYDYIPRTGTAGSFTAAAASTMREVRDSACQGGGKGGVRIGVQSAGHGEKREWKTEIRSDLYENQTLNRTRF